jgi:F420H(2)-dependent quinone reductase
VIPRRRWVPLVARRGGAIHRSLYRASGGRIGGTAWGLPVVLLTTTGRRSGRARTTPLCALPDGDALVVVGSFGGLDTPPFWWLNLQARPEATVQLGRERRAVAARDAEGAERERLWTELIARAPGYLRYQGLTEREIPLVVLEPEERPG